MMEKFNLTSRILKYIIFINPLIKLIQQFRWKSNMLPKFKKEKALAALLYISNELIKKSPERRADLYKLLKILYFADKKHLAKYGRSITGDFYVAMKDGPVPSRTYDMLKHIRGDGYFLSSVEFIDELLRSIEFKKTITVIPKKPPILDDLAKSDMSAINLTIKELKNLNFAQIRKLSHDQAFEEADESNNISMESVARAGGANDEVLSYLNLWLENQTFLVA